jgi:hypothetical protein
MYVNAQSKAADEHKGSRQHLSAPQLMTELALSSVVPRSARQPLLLVINRPLHIVAEGERAVRCASSVSLKKKAQPEGVREGRIGLSGAWDSLSTVGNCNLVGAGALRSWFGDKDRKGAG